ERVRGVGEVESAAYSSLIPLTGGDIQSSFEIEGRPELSGRKQPQAREGFISEDFFRTMGVPLVRGRDFNERDTQDAPRVAVINEEVARRFWSGDDPIGKRIRTGNTSFEIVGVCGAVRQKGLDKPSESEIFLPYRQAPYLFGQLAVRSAADPRGIEATI